MVCGLFFKSVVSLIVQSVGEVLRDDGENLSRPTNGNGPVIQW